MVWLPRHEKILEICLFVSIEHRNVTDTDSRMDTVRQHRTGWCISSRGKKNRDEKVSSKQYYL